MSKRNSDINWIARKFLICPQTIVQAQNIESSSTRVLGLFYTSNLHSDATEIRRTKQALGQCILPWYMASTGLIQLIPGWNFCHVIVCCVLIDFILIGWAEISARETEVKLSPGWKLSMQSALTLVYTCIAYLLETRQGEHYHHRGYIENYYQIYCRDPCDGIGRTSLLSPLWERQLKQKEKKVNGMVASAKQNNYLNE